VLSAISFSAQAFPDPEKGCRCNHLRADAFVQHLSKYKNKTSISEAPL